MDDYVIGLLGRSMLERYTVDQRYTTGRYVMEGSQTSSPTSVCVCATCVKKRGVQECIIKKGPQYKETLKK